MAGDLKTQIAVGVDGTGVTAGVDGIKKSLDTLGQKAAQVGKQASDGIDSIGTGAAPTAAKVDAATKNMIGSIQRQIAVMEAGSKSGADYYRVLAGQRGIDTSALKPYLDQLDAIAVKQKAAVQAGTAANPQGEAVIAGLRDQIRALGMSADEMLKYKAAQAGVGAAAAPLILQLQNMRAAQDAATQSARAGAVAQREAAAAQASRASFLSGLQQQSDSIGKTRSQLLEMQAAQMGLTTQAAPFIAKLREAEGGIGKVGVSAAQTAAALRGVPAQFTDIAVSLQGGMNPLTVFLQQGGQLKDMFGGVGAAARALGGYVLGLVNPYTVAAAAVAALGVAYYQGAQESTAYAKALILSGNVIGKTVGDLQAMAVAISRSTGTQGQAAEALAALASSGKVAGSSMQEVGGAVVSMSRVLGTSVDEAVQTFEKLSDEPAKASAKLNETMHYLNLTTYERIRALEEQGNKEGATALAQTTLANALTGRLQAVEAQAGSLERGWRALAEGAKGAWDAMLGIGRSQSIGDQLSQAQAKLQESQTQAGRGSAFAALYAPAIAKQTQEIAELSRRAFREQENAAAQGEKARTDQAQIGASARVKVLTEEIRTNADKRKKAIADLNNDFKILGKATSGAEYDKLVADINDKFKDPKGAKVKDTTRVDNAAQAKYDIAEIKSNSAAVVEAFTNTQRILEAKRSAGLVSESEYYSERKRLSAESLAAQLQALNLENERLQRDGLNKKDGLDRDREVLKNKQAIAKLTADASVAQIVLDLQAASAIKARETALLSARQAAQDYFDSANQSRETAFRLLGVGGDRRQLEEGIQQIKDRYAAQKRDLDNQRAQAELQGNGSLTEEARKQYDARLAIISEFQVKSIASYESSFARMSAAQLDWSLGATKAMDDYYAQSRSIAGQVEGAFTSAFKGIEDALVGFVTTGKLDFKSLANSIIADIARITIKQSVTGPLAGALGGLLRGGLSGSSAASVANVVGGDDKLGSMISLMGLTKNALGGVYNSPGLSSYSNQVYDKPQLFAFAKGAGVFGEAGPEAIMPLRRGRDGKLGVAASAEGSGGQGMVFSPVTNIQIDARTDQGAVYEIANRAVADAQESYTEELRRMKVLPQ